ncbi:phosphate/phosphite/phosphonate ABC transporter substrate-binding protein [Paenibacillus agricola]|uniref:Phosphate/phosphite/phosphonate ABC transporter substrate-binding protein n=1 Tax=Paenibacillus agricola TaxID=2716264 RepID=A0ABX0J5G2_9BACL|nr:phosphate/phosphite/phosphonate ABC transporter substrate-binding protein [Paenibacillus agricola]NHN29336.1 phosphate/phosphite/phosphonate ABC transporter substrate-binding protein [Paenibacillus agricola]
MFRALATISLSFLLAAGLATGCTGATPPPPAAPVATPVPTPTPAPAPVAKVYMPKELDVQFVPLTSSETIEAKAKQLEKPLTQRLGIPVKIKVANAHSAIVDAIAAKKTDIGFLTPTSYVLAHDEKKTADLLLQASRYGFNSLTAQVDKSMLVNTYQSVVVVNADSPIKTVEDLKGKKIAWLDISASADYIYPYMELRKKNIDLEKDVRSIIVKGQDKAVLAVLHNEVDAAIVFQEALLKVSKGDPDVYAKTRMIYFDTLIPTDTISVRHDMSEEWRNKIADAFIAIGKDSQYQQLLYELFTHRGYTVSDDSRFNVVREANKLLGAK